MIGGVFVCLCVSLVAGQSCYWNDAAVYQMYSSKTPYDSVRGDIRDYPVPENCSAESIWTLNRHGNRNPGKSVTVAIRAVVALKQDIIDAHYAGRGQLCAQDIENFKKWQWNETLEVSQSFLTGTGYEELYDIGKRLREKYPHLVNGGDEEYYFRPTEEQRTITSSLAFVHGWTDTTNRSLSIDGPWERDDIIRPYENCDRYQQLVKNGEQLDNQINAYVASQEYATVMQNVQNRLGITTQLSADEVYSIYEICRFDRSWQLNLKSPWCAAFGHDDLVVLEYRDDVRHYYRNAYGSSVNTDLGKIPLKDMYQKFNSFVQGDGKRLVAYFTHDTMIEMTISALSLFKDPVGVVEGGKRDPNRLWKTSGIGCFSANLLAVLNSCQEANGHVYRVQIFFNEQVTELCPLEGCTWQEFTQTFQQFSTADLDFCSMASRVTAAPDLPDSATVAGLASWMLLLGLAVTYLR